MSELKGKTVAITGGTGTIGKACLNSILTKYADVGRVIIYSRDELKQLEMMDDFPEEKYQVEYYLGDVRDIDRMTSVMEGVDYLIHAAAIKHVVMAEKNPEECWKTNVEGTRNVVKVCSNNKISSATLISTDKAQNPIGVYGKSKLEAERIFLESQSKTRLSVIRLGNVIDSRGSVYEAFRKQRQSGVLKVTHPDASRFCILKEDAASFILDILSDLKSEKVATPKMDSVRIVDLARQIAPECKIEFIGLRPGDKLHEELDGKSSEDMILEYSLNAHGG
ncbi:SDR family NAD(P)-dependent oxidoreductase [Ekhidna sp.]|uniref:SDR family NAD(P)-dependent oxidoreductase n=1 Tax=Ekhidna sp. TaxID=2608089 RepID=UPI003297BE8E